ncbi:hypothetical protein FRC10_009374 [Ceratobasidium sp. 414]|nr:hypothetical protein FRC10_009374 [Ceratobasidium sp. 414]
MLLHKQDKMNEVALDENLDALDPLRHLRDDADNELMPPQIPTVVNQTIELKFPPLEHPVKLVVDAGPGILLELVVECDNV